MPRMTQNRASGVGGFVVRLQEVAFHVRTHERRQVALVWVVPIGRARDALEVAPAVAARPRRVHERVEGRGRQDQRGQVAGGGGRWCEPDRRPAVLRALGAQRVEKREPRREKRRKSPSLAHESEWCRKDACPASARTVRSVPAWAPRTGRPPAGRQRPMDPCHRPPQRLPSASTRLLCCRSPAGTGDMRRGSTTASSAAWTPKATNRPRA